MKVGDVIRYDGVKYTITCFYATFIEAGVEKIKVVETCYDDISGYPKVKVAAVNNSVSPLYVHIPIENVSTLNTARFYNYKPRWKQVYQEILDEQSTEAYWNENDLVPNPGEKSKRFKLF